MSRLYLALDELTQGELTPQRIGRTLQASDSQPEHAIAPNWRSASCCCRAGVAVAAARLEGLPAAHRGDPDYTLTLALTVGVPSPLPARVRRRSAVSWRSNSFSLILNRRRSGSANGR